jgi:hypothetical protein
MMVTGMAKLGVLGMVLCAAFALSMFCVPSAEAASQTKVGTEFHSTWGVQSGSVTNTQADDGNYHTITAFKK